MFDFDHLEEAELPACAPLVVRKVTDGCFEIGDAAVGRVIAQAPPHLAVAVTALGRGALSLAFLGQLAGLEADDCFAYSAFPGSEGAALPARFGPCPPATLVEERSLDVDRRLTELSDAELDAEVAALRSWKQEAGGRLRALERRAAFALLGRSSADSAKELRRAFKRRALSLHPDKGGEAARFQLLQELRRSLFEIAGERKDSAGSDEDSETGVDGNARSPEEDLEDREADHAFREGVFNRRLAEGVRRKLHGDVLVFWERCSKLEAEIRRSSAEIGDCDIESDGWALANLTTFVGRFAPVELAPLRQGDAAGAEEILKRFLEEGGDVLALSSTLDPVGTTSVVVLSLTVPLLERVSSPELRRRCGALLKAISQVPSALQQSSKLFPQGSDLYGADSLDTLAAQETAPQRSQQMFDDVALAVMGLKISEDNVAMLGMGVWRPDGSALYCTFCERWVVAEVPFDPARFRQHCRDDFMHITVAGTLA